MIDYGDHEMKLDLRRGFADVSTGSYDIPSYENYDGAPTEYGTYGDYGYAFAPIMLSMILTMSSAYKRDVPVKVAKK